MSGDTIWLVICGSGVIQSLFLSAYILFSTKIEKQERGLLAALLLAISLRLIKSMGWYFFDEEHALFLNMGFVAHAFIGPLLVLYLSQKVNDRKLLRWQKAIILVPPVLLIIASPFISLHNFWYVGGYETLLYVTLIYFIWAAYLLWKGYKQKHVQFTWLRNLSFGVFLFGMSYFTNFVAGLNSYILGPVLYSLIIYYISFLVFRNPELFDFEGIQKYKNQNLSTQQLQAYILRIEEKMANQKPYLNPNFNLSSFSEMTSLPKHLLSLVFNKGMNRNFSDFTNHYRIEHAKKLLSDPSHHHFKIASIAYDCGFNSLSAFNAAFRKFNSVSPSEFRKNHTAIAS